jgi:hypothetical protein
MRPRIWIEKKLVRVKPVTGRWLVRSVDAKTVERSRPDVGDAAVENFVGKFGKLKSLKFPFAVFVEEANIDTGGVS